MANDILLGADGDLLIVDGDLVIGPANQQSIQLLIASAQGSWVDNPLGGVGILNYVNAPMDLATQDVLRRDVQEQMEMDGFEKSAVSLTTKDGKLQDVLIDGN